MTKSLIQRIKETTPQDILLTGVLIGAFAGMSGAMNWVDKSLMGYTMGFKSNMKVKQVMARGALVGGVLSIPFAFYSATSVLDNGSLGVLTNPSAQDRLPLPPVDYVYAQQEGGQPYLIIDPKYGM